MNKRRFHIALIAIVSILVIVAVLIWLRREAITPPFRVGFNTWVGYGPLYIAQDKGFFKSAGLNVQLERIEGTGERRAAILAGRLEAMGSTVDDLIVGASQGLKAKCILVVDESNGADGILSDKSIQNTKDLKGKRIAVQPGFVNHFFLLYILDKAGIEPNEVTIVPMEPDKAGPAFIHGDIDVAVTWEPWLSKAKNERSDAHVLIDTQKERGIIVDIFAVRDDILQNRKEDAQKFVLCWNQAVDFLRSNPKEGNMIIAKAMRLSVEEAEEMLSGVIFLAQEENRQFVTSGRLKEVTSKANILWHKAGFIKELQDIDSLLDTRFIQQAP